MLTECWFNYIYALNFIAFTKRFMMLYAMKRLLLLPILMLAVICGQAQNKFFADAPENSFVNPAQQRVIIPNKYRTVKLLTAELSAFLQSLPGEQNITDRKAAPVLQLPMPDGSLANFNVWETAVMAPELAAANPGIKTFSGQGIDDPTAIIQFDWTEYGFHAMILSPVTGTVFIDPYSQRTITNYIAYYKADFIQSRQFVELPPIRPAGTAGLNSVLAANCIGVQLRTYRLAIACTHQYATAVTGTGTPTTAQVLAKIVITVNRVNGVYQNELAIRLQLIGAESSIIFTAAVGDPFTGNSNGNTLIDESQREIDARIGNANYDIGHTFSTGGGGVAQVGVVCATGVKAKGITGSSNPVGDAYDIDFVAHEIGHQFGANHPFNSETFNCGGGNWNGTTNAEPGSGSTVMAYAGICAADDLQPHSDAQFHAVSFDEIINYSNTGSGNSCAAITGTGNTPPVINAGLDYVIPKSTPFILSGSGSDVNGDALTFSWEQVDVGGPSGTWNNPSGNAPLFRSFGPQTTPVRFFPKLSSVIRNTDSIGELLPTYGRTMHFRLTGRDNRAGGGGVCFDETTITIAGNAGPFTITYPNASGITWLVNDFKTITWDASGTTAAPVSCANVKIELSTDGGLTYPITIAASTPNDGIEEINVPNNITTTARLRISAAGNIFYDISNNNFSIQNPAVSEFVFSNPEVVTICGGSTGVATINTASLNGFSTAIDLTATGVPAGSTLSFGSNTLTPGSNTTVTLNNTNTLPAGIYNISVNGAAAAVNKTRVISFVVSGIPAAPASLTTPAVNAIGVSLVPSFNWAAVTAANLYTLEISASSSFATVTQTIANITSLPVVPGAALVENTVYYWRVKAFNTCGVSPFSATGVFKTGMYVCNLFTSADVPKVISETGTPVVTSTLTIPAGSGTSITDINVTGLKGTHTYVGDLMITLKSPTGTIDTLFKEICGNATDFDINLDDEAVLGNITCPLTGNQTARPLRPLSVFDGQNSAGVWTLTVYDFSAQDGGTLTGWGLAINCAFVATPINTSPWTLLCPPSAGTSLTANITGAAYQWQVDAGSGFSNLSNDATYSGVNALTLQIANAPSFWTGYKYRCIVDGSNSTIFTLGFTSYWNGSVNNAWEVAGNWSCNTIPDAYTDVIINSGSVVINSNAVCRSIKASPGSTVTVNAGFKISVMH